MLPSPGGIDAPTAQTPALFWCSLCLLYSLHLIFRRPCPFQSTLQTPLPLSPQTVTHQDRNGHFISDEEAEAQGGEGTTGGRVETRACVLPGCPGTETRCPVCRSRIRAGCHLFFLSSEHLDEMRSLHLKLAMILTPVPMCGLLPRSKQVSASAGCPVVLLS